MVEHFYEYIYWYSFLIGLIFLFSGVIQLRKAISLIKAGKRTTGTVIGINADTSDETTTYSRVVEYQDHMQSYFVHESQSTSHPNFKEGDQCIVIFNPNNRREAYIFDFWEVFGFSIFLLIFSTPFLIISISYILYQYG